MVLVPQVTAGLPGVRLHVAASRLADVLRQLRDDAVRTGQPTYLSLDTSRRQYRETGATDWQKFPTVVQEAKFWRDSPIPGMTQNSVFFFPDGSASGGIIVLRTDSRSAKITIEWLTGRVRDE